MDQFEIYMSVVLHRLWKLWNKKELLDEELLKCSPNINADIRFEPLLKVVVSSWSKELDTVNKSELGIKTYSVNLALDVSSIFG